MIGCYRLGRIEWLLNSSELAWKNRNIRLMTDFNLLELSTYLVKTWLTGIGNSRSRESTISLSVSA